MTDSDQHPWGRVDDDVSVYVREAEGERLVGQYPDGSKEEALRYFERKHGLESVSYRISNPYGPRQHAHKKQGVIPISHSQDTVGPMVRSVADAAIMLDTLRSPFGESWFPVGCAPESGVVEGRDVAGGQL